MCNLGGAVGLAQGVLSVGAQNSAYSDKSERYLENAGRVKKAQNVQFQKLGTQFNQENLIRTLKKMRIDEASSKALARSRNTNSSKGLVAGQVIADSEQSIEKKALRAEGFVDVEQENANNAFGLKQQDIELQAEYQIDALWPGEAPDPTSQGIGVILSGLAGYLASEGKT